MPFTSSYDNLTTAPGTPWLRGNLHTHTTRSDGSKPPQDVIDGYARLGYDFLMLSDHDLVSSPDIYASLDARGLTLLHGNEVTANGPHILHVGAAGKIEPDADRQRVMEGINAQGEGSFAIINHPC